jgi:PAS domain S-box-containing protein
MLEQVLENVNQGVIVVDQDFQITYVNHLIEKLFQVHRDEVLQKNIDELLRLSSICMQPVKQNIVDRKEFSFECLPIDWNNEKYFLRIQTKTIKKNDEMTGTVYYFENITDQVNHNLHLIYEKQKSNRQFYEVFNNANDAMMLYRLDGIRYQLIDVNQKAISLLEYTKAEFLTLGPLSLTDESYRAKTTYTTETFHQDNKIEIEWLYRSKSGIKIPVELSVSKFTIGDQDYMLSIARDITERKNAEQELIEANTFKTTLINSLENGIAVIENGQIKITNKKWYEILALNPNDTTFEEKTGEEIISILTSVVKNIDQVLKVVAMVKQEKRIKNHEFDLVDGRTIEVDYFPIFVQEEYYGHVWMTRDVTYRKIEEKRLEEARKEAEQANKAKNLFLSRMSHDLRTPLNSIIGFSQILLETDDVSYLIGHKSKIKRILNAGEHLLSLIKDMLDFSIIESGDIKLDVKPAPLKDLLVECMRTLKREAEKREITLSLLSISSSLCIEIDQVRFKQIMLNLMTNAIKYNHVNGTVTIWAAEDHDHITVFVRDTGNGIAKEDQEYVFSSMYRSQRHKDIEGTGLGLSIVAELTKKMNGKYGFDSVENKGSTFWVSFPRCENPCSV